MKRHRMLSTGTVPAVTTSPAMRGSAAIVGVGEADFEPAPGTSLELNAQAVIRALQDVELPLADVDGLFTGYTLMAPHFMYSTALCECMGMSPKLHATLEQGGATPASLVIHAVTAMKAGLCEVCVVVYADNRGSAAGLADTLKTIANVRDHYSTQRGHRSRRRGIAVNALSSHPRVERGGVEKQPEAEKAK